MKKQKLRKALAEYLESPAGRAMWIGHAQRKGFTQQDAQDVIDWMSAWAKKEDKQ